MNQRDAEKIVKTFAGMLGEGALALRSEARRGLVLSHQSAKAGGSDLMSVLRNILTPAQVSSAEKAIQQGLQEGSLVSSPGRTRQKGLTSRGAQPAAASRRPRSTSNGLERSSSSNNSDNGSQEALNRKASPVDRSNNRTAKQISPEYTAKMELVFGALDSSGISSSFGKVSEKIRKAEMGICRLEAASRRSERDTSNRQAEPWERQGNNQYSAVEDSRENS